MLTDLKAHYNTPIIEGVGLPACSLQSRQNSNKEGEIKEGEGTVEVPLLRRGVWELCASPVLLLLGAGWGGHIPRGQPGIRVPAPHPTPASFWGPSFGVQELNWTCSITRSRAGAPQKLCPW